MPGINQKWWKGGAGSQIMFHLWNFLSSSFLVNFIYHGNHILTKNLFEWWKHPVSSQSAVNTYNLCSFCKTAEADMASENITSCWGCNAPWLCLDGIVCQASQVGCVQKGSAPSPSPGRGWQALKFITLDVFFMLWGRGSVFWRWCVLLSLNPPQQLFYLVVIFYPLWHDPSCGR